MNETARKLTGDLRKEVDIEDIDYMLKKEAQLRVVQGFCIYTLGFITGMIYLYLRFEELAGLVLLISFGVFSPLINIYFISEIEKVKKNE